MKSHKVILINVENAFDKIKNPLMIKSLSNLRIEENYLNLIKNICTMSTAKCILNDVKD